MSILEFDVAEIVRSVEVLMDGRSATMLNTRDLVFAGTCVPGIQRRLPLPDHREYHDSHRNGALVRQRNLNGNLHRRQFHDQMDA
jgi:hypothetical protein